MTKEQRALLEQDELRAGVESREQARMAATIRAERAEADLATAREALEVYARSWEDGHIARAALAKLGQ